MLWLVEGTLVFNQRGSPSTWAGGKSETHLLNVGGTSGAESGGPLIERLLQGGAGDVRAYGGAPLHSNLHHFLAGDRPVHSTGDHLQLLHQLIKLFQLQRLGSVADGIIRIVVNFDQ